MNEELEALEVWHAVEQYIIFYHHQVVKSDIHVETIKGMPVNIIEKTLKAFKIIKEICNFYFFDKEQLLIINNCSFIIIKNKEKYDLLKEVLK
jgi:hypothetical protein